MKLRIYFLLASWLVIGLSDQVLAQVKIGNNPTTINASAALEIESTNKGFLPPRVSLSSSTDGTTIPNPATGLVVYNTNANMTGGRGVNLYVNKGTPGSPNWANVETSTSAGTFVPYVVAAVRGTTDQVVPAATIVSAQMPTVQANDGNYSTSTYIYTVPAGGDGFYQVVGGGAVQASSNNSSATFFVYFTRAAGDARYIMSGIANYGSAYTFYGQGTAVEYLQAGDSIKMQLGTCIGCNVTPETYTFKIRQMVITRLSN